MAKPKPEEEKRPFTVKPPQSLYEDIEALARRSGVPLNTYVCAWLTEAAERGIIVNERTQYILQPTDPAYLAFLEYQDHAAKQQEAADKAAQPQPTGPARPAVSYLSPGRPDPRLNDTPADQSPDPDPDQDPPPPAPTPKKPTPKK